MKKTILVMFVILFFGISYAEEINGGSIGTNIQWYPYPPVPKIPDPPEDMSLHFDVEYIGYGVAWQTLSQMAVTNYYKENNIKPDVFQTLTPIFSNILCATLVQAYKPAWNWNQWGNQIFIGGVLSTFVLKMNF